MQNTEQNTVLADALRHHQAGKLGDSERLYLRVLQLEPDNAHALHGLGMLYLQTGRKDAGIDLMRQAIARDGKVPAFHFNLGNVLKTHGALDEAAASYRRALTLKPVHADAHHNLGIALAGMGQREEAMASYRKALALRPDNAKTHNDLGNVLSELNRLEDAAASYRQALGLRPDMAEAHNNLGNVLTRQGKLDEAVASYTKALAHQPDLAQAHNNLGNALKDQGKLEEAIAAYRRAIAGKPDLASAHNNLGNALKAQGKLRDAGAAYQAGLAAQPGFAPLSSNLALLLSESGQYEFALEAVMQGLRSERTPQARAIFAECVKNLRWSEAGNEIRDLMAAALTEAWGRPEDLAPAATGLALLNPDLAEPVAAVAAVWPERLAAATLITALTRVGDDPLLRALMLCAPICDAGLERLLTSARHALLEARNDAPLDFFAVLARQCFINDYVFCTTPDEWRRAEKLRDDTAAALTAGTPASAQDVVTVAAYFSLASLPSCERLLESAWPQALGDLLIQQIREPQEEARDKRTIAQLTPIDEPTSVAVRDQYEESPYPRWVNRAPAGPPKSLAEYLADKFPISQFRRPPAGSIDILIAGCGTGQHAIETAWAFADARVQAVDLSLSSLAYARRKTRALGVTGISYGQGDLLKLDPALWPFDIIESVGVLHHLADPWAGWKALLPLLRPGGFMHIGLYSQTARRKIVGLREWIAQKGFGASPDDIRAFRQALMDSPDAENYRGIIQSIDFCSLSNCRDLLFHVQEHRLTLPAIKTFLQENDLTFLGFSLEGGVLNAYRERFAGDPAATDLVQWHRFEQENPGTFTGMYNFWVQRA